MGDSNEELMSLRYVNLEKSFKLGIRALLTAFSREDVDKAFPTFTNAQRDNLYSLFVQAIKSLHENIEEEFKSICQETEVTTTLAMIEQLVEQQKLDVLSADESNLEEIKETLSVAKKDEIEYLTSMLKKAEEQNMVIRTRVDSLKRAQSFSTIADAVEKLRSSWNSNARSFSSS